MKTMPNGFKKPRSFFGSVFPRKAVGLLALLSLVWPALAQKEQWLEYHTSTENRGYRILEISTNPPAGVPLPKFRSAKPYFGRWTTPMDAKGGRWFCFDTTRKSGPYDRVYFDSTGNGRLDDKTPAAATRSDNYNAFFDPIKVVFKGEDGPVAYHLNVRFMQYDGSPAQVLLSSGGYYSGPVAFGSKKYRLSLYDNNVNGIFNDPSSQGGGGGDRLSVEGDKSGPRFLGKLLALDGEFFRIEVARDGAFVKVEKASDIVLGTVRVPETISEFVALGENGHFIRKPAKGEFTLPSGKYRVYSWTINRKDAKGASWALEGSRFDSRGDFVVSAGSTPALNIGEPARSVLGVEETRSPLSFDLSFVGPLGESLNFSRNNENPPPPRLTLAGLDGKYRSTNTFEFG